jgi:hypothetical protein
MLSTVGKFIYTKYWGLLYVEHCGKIYLHTILGNTLCWAQWEYWFTHNTGDYFMLSTVGRFIYTRYWGLHYVEHCRQDLFTQNTEEYFMLNTVGRFIYTKYWGILYGEHCGKIYLHKILGITSCWVEHCGNIYSHKIMGITLWWAMWEDLFTQNTEEYCMLNTVGRFIYTKYWGILYVEHCGKIYLHKILGNTLCWAQWEYWFTHNTGDYFMLSTVGRFIYTKYWGILYVEQCGKIYLHKIPRNTLCWALWEDLITQNTEEYCMLSTVGRFIYTKYWGILYIEHCGKIYLHKILRNTLCRTLWEDLFTQNTEEYFYVEHYVKIYLHKILRNTLLSTVGRFIYTKYW